jgi:hypothetical protein
VPCRIDVRTIIFSAQQAKSLRQPQNTTIENNKIIMRFVIIPLSLATLGLAFSNANVHAEFINVKSFLFHKDAAGSDKCTEARDAQEDPETFRLYCVNKPESFKYCAVTCSEALTFEGSVGRCKDHECDFYDYSFRSQDAEMFKMHKMAKGKATLFAVVPLWESQAQYFYELMEEVRKDYKQGTVAFLLPMDVDPEEATKIKTFHSQRVNILNNTSPFTIRHHPFLEFISTLRYSSGFRDFNVFTDRPVMFMISPDGKTVERLVVPTYAQITNTLDDFGINNNAEL